MWLLNTHTGKLHYFSSPDSPELRLKGYAILSHCWGKPQDEQSFQDTKALEKYENPREHATEKIKKFCELAESLEYDWGWADTCCIDKISSSELSEAINSMFRYYSLARVCIVFLHDVPNGCDLAEAGSKFRESRWHKRGWTLQELIAPENVVFYSQNWTRLSTKADEATLLQEITHIPKDVLAGKKALTEVSVAARMSWAAYRETTREEDEAYCLLGILKVDMYSSYGEGRHAFYRLQEELIKRSTDTSLFAWGKVMKMELFRSLQNIPLPDAMAQHHEHKSSESFLFAPSPACFRAREGANISFDPKLPLGSTFTFDISRFLTFTTTPYGILAHFPVAELKSQRLLIAFIACSKGGQRLGLVLKACSNAEATSPNGPIYDVTDFLNYGGTIRLASLTREQTPFSELNFEWRDVYIRTRPSAGSSIKLPDLEELEEEDEEDKEPAVQALPTPPTNSRLLSTDPSSTSPPPAVSPLPMNGPLTSTSGPSTNEAPPPSTNEPPPTTDASTPPTIAPPPSVKGGVHTSYAGNGVYPPTSGESPPPSAHASPLTMQALHDAPSPPTTQTQPPEANERPATADEPLAAVAQATPSPYGRREHATRARRKEGGFVTWARRLLQRMAAVFGIPVTESS